MIWFVFLGSGVRGGESSPIYYYDISPFAAFDPGDPGAVRTFWDTLHLLSSLQGIVNREKETLFLRAQPKTDDFWWEELRKEGHWLAGRKIVRIESLEELLKIFAPKIRGAVVYGESPHSLSNLASTIAGVESRVCLRFDTNPNCLYQNLLRENHEFAKREHSLFLCDPEDGSAIFTGKPGSQLPKITPQDQSGEPQISVGSAKCDSYLWAKRNYLDTGRVSKKDMSYYLDSYWLKHPNIGGVWNNTLINHDFTISRAGFFFELHCWGDEAPIDDPQQPIGSDLETVRKILKAMHRHSGGEILEIHGFTPWLWKYTSHGIAGSKYDPVPTEWEKVRVFSAYNAVIDADALGYSAMSNGSFYQHFPMEEHYPQPPRPDRDSLKNRGLIDERGKVVPKSYFMFYMGDYDCAPWLSTMVPELWNDPARGTIPCNWAFNPNLDQRAPHVLHYVRKNAKENDWFISGDCGAGYLNPGMLTAPRLDPEIPEGWTAWTRHNVRYFRKYDLDITGFVIDGFAPEMGEEGLKAYSTFSPAGLIGQKVPYREIHFGMPVIPMRHDLYGEPEKAAKELSEHFAAAREPGKPLFMPIRTILKTPTWHKRTMEETLRLCGEENVCFLDAYSFFLLMRTAIENGQ